jgi:hypothetical protein
MSNEQTIEIEPALRKRPKLIWIISIFYIFSAGWTVLSFALIYSGAIPINEAQKAYFDSQNIFDNILTLAMGSLNILGAILLFLLRRHAFHCFLAAFFIGALMTVYHIMFKNWLGVIGGPGLIGAVIGWFISIAIILYSNKLIKKEILR